MDKILGIVNLHSESEFGSLTSKKNIATTSFLGRYYFIDFVLSRFTNCNINNIEILVKNRPTSLFQHLNIGAKEWSVNTQTGGINLMYNELENKKSYMNTDFNTLLCNKKYLYKHNQAFVLVAPCEILSNIDYQAMVESHIKSGKLITIAYKNCADEISMYREVDKVYLNGNTLNHFTKDVSNPNVYMETFVIHRTKLIEILENFDSTDEIPTFKDIISYAAKLDDVNTYEYTGFMRYFRSLENYIDYSLEMLNPDNYNKLFNTSSTIYTRGYNTPPTVYGKNSNVTGCYISNGCNIKGKVSNSIIGRNVVIDEGAVVSNSIIFSHAHIKSNSTIEDAIIENSSVVNENVRVKGNIKKPAYIQSKN